MQANALDSLSDLARKLGIHVERLHLLLKNAETSYHRFPLRTKRRRARWIDAPNTFLKLVQRRVLDRILYQAIPHSAAHGFYPERSIVSNAEKHIRSKWVLSLDIKDFFPSTDVRKVQRALQGFLGIEGKSLDAILRLTCRRGALPQGAPTSPHIANLTFFKGDELIDSLASEHGLSYTRYADDMTLSGNTLPEGLEGEIEEIVSSTGYRLAKEKTKRMGSHQCQKVTGLVVNEGVRLPRGQLRRLRAIRHDLQTNGWEAALARSGFRSYSELAGNLAFEQMVAKSGKRENFQEEKV